MPKRIKKRLYSLMDKTSDYGSEVEGSTPSRVKKLKIGSITIPTHIVPEDFIIYAFRYCLGRQSYAVGWMTGWLTVNWKKLSPKVKDLVKKEIRQAETQYQNGFPHALGADFDRREWLRILEL